MTPARFAGLIDAFAEFQIICRRAANIGRGEGESDIPARISVIGMASKNRSMMKPTIIWSKLLPETPSEMTEKGIDPIAAKPTEPIR